MPWGAVAGAVVGGLFSSNASRRASNAQTGAARDANALQQSQYDTTRADNEPWRAAGRESLTKLMGLLNDGSLTSRFAGKLDNEAGYQFARDEGMKAINSRAAADGGFGGDTMKAGIRFAQGNANQFYNDSFNRWNTENTNTFNRLSGIAGTGQQINDANAAAGRNFANQSGGNLLYSGNARADGIVERGNIYGNALNQGIAAWNRRPRPGTRADFRYDDPYRNPNYFGGGEGE